MHKHSLSSGGITWQLNLEAQSTSKALFLFCSHVSPSLWEISHFDCESWPGNEFDGSILTRQTLTGHGQHPNIVLWIVSNTSCLAYILNEMEDRRESSFPILVCNQSRKNALDLLCFRIFLGRTLNKYMMEFKCSSSKNIFAVPYLWYADELAAPDRWFPDTHNPLLGSGCF